MPSSNGARNGKGDGKSHKNDKALIDSVSEEWHRRDASMYQSLQETCEVEIHEFDGALCPMTATIGVHTPVDPVIASYSPKLLFCFVTISNHCEFFIFWFLLLRLDV